MKTKKIPLLKQRESSIKETKEQTKLGAKSTMDMIKIKEGIDAMVIRIQDDMKAYNKLAKIMNMELYELDPERLKERNKVYFSCGGLSVREGNFALLAEDAPSKGNISSICISR